jgi:serine/threonine protein kinase
MNEYNITKMIAEKQCKYLIPLIACYLGKDHIALKLEKLKMDLRNYLHYSRDPEELNSILIDTILSLQELHDLGYVHRDLKPDNIVLSSKPYKAKIIDFNRAVSREATTVGSVKGTPGYFPQRDDWRDGGIKWDLWLIVAIILECDMPVGKFKNAGEEEGALYYARNHKLEKGVSKQLLALVDEVMLSKKKEPNTDLHRIIKVVEKTKFKYYQE